MFFFVLSCLLLVFGPLLAFCQIVLARRATLSILAIGSGFSWLCGLFVASVLWFVLSPAMPIYAVTVVVAVVAGEGFRFLFWLVWTKGHRALDLTAGKPLDNDGQLFLEAVAAGVGSALCSSLIYAGVLWSAWGPGVLSNTNCFGVNIFLLGAVLQVLWNLLHLLWTVAAHAAYRSGSYRWTAAVAASHLLASLSTVFNSTQFGAASGLCIVPLLVLSASAVVWSWVVWRSAKTILAPLRKIIS